MQKLPDDFRMQNGKMSQMQLWKSSWAFTGEKDKEDFQEDTDFREKTLKKDNIIIQYHLIG